MRIHSFEKDRFEYLDVIFTKTMMKIGNSKKKYLYLSRMLPNSLTNNLSTFWRNKKVHPTLFTKIKKGITELNVPNLKYRRKIE